MPNALDNLTLRASVLEVLIQTDFTLRGPFTLGRHEEFYVASSGILNLRDMVGPPKPTRYDVTRPDSFMAQNFLCLPFSTASI